MEEARFEAMGAYVMERQNTVVKYIKTRLILELCKKKVRRPGTWVARSCWENMVLNLAGARAVAAAAADGKEGRKGKKRSGRRHQAGTEDRGYHVAQ